MNKKQVIAALLENIENQRVEHTRRCKAYQNDLSMINENGLNIHAELQRVKTENDRLLQEAEVRYKEYVEDTTSAISGEARVCFNQLFNIKESLNGLRSTESEGKLQDRIQQVLAYIYEEEFCKFFYRNKGLLFDILAKVQPGCVIEPNDSK